MGNKVINAKQRTKPTKVVQPLSTLAPASMPTKKRTWFEYLQVANGLKWGAIVTLIGYNVAENRNSDGLMLAAAILAVFTVLEWTASLWAEFKGRG